MSVRCRSIRELVRSTVRASFDRKLFMREYLQPTSNLNLLIPAFATYFMQGVVLLGLFGARSVRCFSTKLQSTHNDSMPHGGVNGSVSARRWVLAKNYTLNAPRVIVKRTVTSETALPICPFSTQKTVTKHSIPPAKGLVIHRGCRHYDVIGRVVPV